MDCEWVGLLLVDHLDGACIDPLREKIDRHLAGCAACRAERDALAGVDGALAGARVPEPPQTLTDDVMRGALRPVAPVPKWREVRSLAAAAAVLGMAVGLYSFSPQTLGSYLPDSDTVAAWVDAAARKGESLASSVVNFAREQWDGPSGRP